MDVIFYVLGHLPDSLAIFVIPILMLGGLFSGSCWAENRFDMVIKGAFRVHHIYFFSGVEERRDLRARIVQAKPSLAGTRALRVIVAPPSRCSFPASTRRPHPRFGNNGPRPSPYWRTELGHPPRTR
jgi:hypothetical protein